MSPRRAMITEVGVAVILPVMLYYGLREPLGDTHALIVSSLPPLMQAVWGFARERRLDALSLLVLGGLVLSGLAMIGGGSFRYFQIREKLVTLIIGLAFLASALFGRPLVQFLAEATLRRQAPERAAWLTDRRAHPPVRDRMMCMTVVWGGGLVLEATVAIALVFVLDPGRYLIVSPVLGYASMAALGLWTAWYRRRIAHLPG
ncbi:hypothetical protein KGY14_08160 [Ameyamaea chiangmaiensis]|uniref:Transmembrane protein n=2 Tax=Ameyamaea chiangmaiensis TaxID=442969 RepID=A0A850PE44_9PROT|nr:VC0807 family protein [Ameyamaea chiangmaiensis]MBS4075164.1 hypothetical protein [Ameyamaea chiangmaiensis]NVN40212.1 hypothetical protein [Ameyamaea chiangmaiensis]